MGSRTMATVVTADTMALNAAMYGFAGHSLLTPHAAIQQIWWTEERINAKVTREFIISKLRIDERERLYSPLAFGDGLTDDTYMDWILARAKRFYLILVECGVPDQIFGIIDDSWDDDDLPVAFADVDRLALSYKTDERLNRKFHSTQYQYVLRPLSFGEHIDYASNEVVPIEYVHRVSPAAALQHWSRIHMPKAAETVYMRRKLSLGTKDEPDPMLHLQFFADVATARSLNHAHIAPVWASYTQANTGYFITTFLSEHTLKSFIEFRSPTSFQKVERSERHAIILGWMHCLADAINCLHEKGMCHSAVMPSNIVINAQNEIAFSDLGSLKSFQTDKKRDPAEAYNYGAPENHPSIALEEPVRPLTSAGRGGKRKKSTDSKRSSDAGSRSSRSHDSFGSRSGSDKSFGNLDSRPLPPPPPEEASPQLHARRFGSDSSTKSPQRDMSLTLNPGMLLTMENSLVPLPVDANDDGSPMSPKPIVVPPPVDAKSDIFSLGCVYLDMVTFLFRKKPYAEFVKHRTAKYKQAKGTRIDQSFHANRDKVVSWIELLESEEFEGDDDVSKAMPSLFSLIRLMLNANPLLRPSAAAVRDRLLDVLVSEANIPSLHCAGQTAAPCEEADEEVPVMMEAPAEVETEQSPAVGRSNSTKTGISRLKLPPIVGSNPFKSRPWKRRQVEMVR